MPTLLTTGLQGLVGSRIAADLAETYSFESLDVNHPITPVNITDAEAVNRAFAASEASAILHLAAYTDVTGAWQQTNDKSGIAYQVNVLGTQNIVKAAATSGKHLIHISTAYVFDGQKTDMYSEGDSPAPIEWYGQTKLWAEEAVQASAGAWTILRIDQPFRSDMFSKPDAVRKIINLLQTNPEAKLFADHWFGPTYIDDLSQVVEWVIRTGTTGLFHATAGERWSDYDFGQLINTTLNLGLAVKPGSLTEYLQRSQRPYQRNTSLDCSKLKSVIDFKLDSVSQAVGKIRV